MKFSSLLAWENTFNWAVTHIDHGLEAFFGSIHIHVMVAEVLFVVLNTKQSILYKGEKGVKHNKYDIFDFTKMQEVKIFEKSLCLFF